MDNYQKEVARFKRENDKLRSIHVDKIEEERSKTKFWKERSYHWLDKYWDVNEGSNWEMDDKQDIMALADMLKRCATMFEKEAESSDRHADTVAVSDKWHDRAAAEKSLCVALRRMALDLLNFSDEFICVDDLYNGL